MRCGIQERARARMEETGEEPIPATVALLGFESPKDPERFDPAAADHRWRPVTERYPALSQAFAASVFEVDADPEWVEAALRELDLPEA